MVGVGWSGLEWVGVDWSDLEWPRVAWSELERNSIKSFPNSLVSHLSYSSHIPVQALAQTELQE